MTEYDEGLGKGLSSTSQGYSIPEAARQLGVSAVTIRRYIKQGKLEANKVEGKFGSEYRIPALPSELLGQEEDQPAQQPLSYTVLLEEIQRLNHEMGYWQGRCEELANQLKLLTAPKLPWWKRLFRR